MEDSGKYPLNNKFFAYIQFLTDIYCFNSVFQVPISTYFKNKIIFACTSDSIFTKRDALHEFESEKNKFYILFLLFILSIIKTLSERIWTSELYGMNLTQFYINFLRQEHQIELSWVSINSCTVRLRKTIST